MTISIKTTCKMAALSRAAGFLNFFFARYFKN
jgi:hypothetical protein